MLLLVLLVLPWRRGCSMGLLRRVKSMLRDLLRLAVLLAAMVTTEAVPPRVATHSRSLLVSYEVANLLPN